MTDAMTPSTWTRPDTGDKPLIVRFRISEFVTGSLTNGERTTQCYRAMIAAANKESRE